MGLSIFGFLDFWSIYLCIYLFIYFYMYIYKSLTVVASLFVPPFVSTATSNGRPLVYHSPFRMSVTYSSSCALASKCPREYLISLAGERQETAVLLLLLSKRRPGDQNGVLARLKDKRHLADAKRSLN